MSFWPAYSKHNKLQNSVSYTLCDLPNHLFPLSSLDNNFSYSSLKISFLQPAPLPTLLSSLKKWLLVALKIRWTIFFNSQGESSLSWGWRAFSVVKSTDALQRTQVWLPAPTWQAAHSYCNFSSRKSMALSGLHEHQAYEYTHTNAGKTSICIKY